MAKQFNIASSTVVVRWVDLVREQGYAALRGSHRRNSFKLNPSLSLFMVS